MLIYNVTVKIDNQIHDDWFDWMKKIHIPEVLDTGKFVENKMYKVLVDDLDGVTYSIQYTCKDMDTLNDYLKNHAPALQKAHINRYKDKFVAFRTFLELV